MCVCVYTHFKINWSASEFGFRLCISLLIHMFLMFNVFFRKFQKLAIGLLPFRIILTAHTN